MDGTVEAEMTLKRYCHNCHSDEHWPGECPKPKLIKAPPMKDLMGVFTRAPAPLEGLRVPATLNRPEEIDTLLDVQGGVTGKVTLPVTKSFSVTKSLKEPALRIHDDVTKLHCETCRCHGKTAQTNAQKQKAYRDRKKK